MVLKYPKAVWEPLGTQSEPSMKSHDIICLHTMVGSLSSTSNYFHWNGYGGTESHLGVGESKAQGVEQWQDGMYQADANLDGNHRVFSVETADLFGVFGTWNTKDGNAVPAWTDDQLDMIVDIVVWWCRKETHVNCPSTWKCHQVGVPCVLIPDTKPGRRGVAYHQQGCDPVRVDGGELWSRAYGKVCPGRRRINQLLDIVIPRARKILYPVSTLPPEDDMAISLAQMKELKDWIQLMAVANNNYTRQVLGNAVRAILAEIEEVDEETALAVAAKLDAKFEELSNQIIADAATAGAALESESPPE